MKANLWDGCTLNESLNRSLNVMRRSVHSNKNESLFERHYRREPRTEMYNYLNMSPNVKATNISAKPETLQVCSFASSDRHYDQLLIKATKNLKEDVSSNLPYLFLEKRGNKNKLKSAYETKPQIAVAGTKHTITTDTNKILHR